MDLQDFLGLPSNLELTDSLQQGDLLLGVPKPGFSLEIGPDTIFQWRPSYELPAWRNGTGNTRKLQRSRCSKHQTGYAADLVYQLAVVSLACSMEYQWKILQGGLQEGHKSEKSHFV